MVGEIPVDGECSVCGGKVGIIEEEIEKKQKTPMGPQMYFETYKITKCLDCGHVFKKELIKSTELT